MSSSMYLNCHSYYSLRYGTMPVEKLVSEANRNGVSALALTDINNTMGTMDFIRECKLNNIKPMAGIEFRDDENELIFTALARNNDGFREINEFLTWHNLNDTSIPPCPPVFNHTYVIYPFQSKLPRKLKENEFVGIRPEEIRKLVFSKFRYNQSQLIAFQPVTFSEETDYILHKHLRAIDNNTLLSKLTPSQLASPKEKLLPPDFLCIAYEDHPQIIKNTERLVEECDIDFNYNTVKN